MGPCSRGPLVTLQQPGQEDVIYEEVTPEVALEIIDKHVTQAQPVVEHVLPDDAPFFAKQQQGGAGQQRADRP